MSGSVKLYWINRQTGR